MIEVIKNNIIKNDDFWDFIKKVPSPCYVYNIKMLKDICSTINKNIEPFNNIKFYYAMKANNNLEVLKAIKIYVDGIDVATIEEFLLAKKAGFRDISCNGPSFNIDSVKIIYESKQILDFDNLDQLYQAKDIIKNKKIGLRINVENSRFGLNIENKYLESFIINNNITVTRIHFHYEEKNLDDFTIFKKISEKIKSNTYLNNVNTINIGGGFDKILLNNDFGKYLEIINRIFKGHEIIIEPGKGVVDYCGFLVTTVISSNKNNDMNEVVLNTSAHNTLTWFMPRPIYTTSTNNENIKTSIYGNSCYEEDKFAINLVYPLLQVNDMIVFFPVGAYSAVNNKNLHNQPNLEEYIYDLKDEMFYGE